MSTPPILVRRVLALGVMLSVGCALPLDALRPEDGGGSGIDAARMGSTDAGTDTASPVPGPDSSLRDSGSALDTGTADGMRPSGDSGPLPVASCGVLGTPCCDPDQRCDLGACLRGMCVAYGGAFSTLESCSPECRSRNVYTAGCSCPRGFVPSPVMDVRASCDGTPASASLSICTSGPRTSPSDYAGAWLETFGCGAHCLRANAYTGGCSCPVGTQAAAMHVEVRTSCGTTPATFALCVSVGMTTATFGGAYQLGADGAPGCTEPNPLTGACSCPVGATAQSVPTINDVPGGFAAAPIVLCSR